LIRGLGFALATDFNPGTSPTLNLSLVGVLARLEMRMSLPEVISALTFNAIRALSLEETQGAISAGLKCRFYLPFRTS